MTITRETLPKYAAAGWEYEFGAVSAYLSDARIERVEFGWNSPSDFAKANRLRLTPYPDEATVVYHYRHGSTLGGPYMMAPGCKDESHG